MSITETIEKSACTIIGLIFINNFGARIIDPYGDKLLHEMLAKKFGNLGKFVRGHIKIQ